MMAQAAYGASESLFGTERTDGFGRRVSEMPDIDANLLSFAVDNIWKRLKALRAASDAIPTPT